MSGAVEILEPEGEALLDASADLERVADGLTWAEGPVWDFGAAALVFSDVVGNTAHRYDADHGVRVHRRPSDFANGRTIDASGSLVTCEHGTRRVTRETSAGVETVVDAYAGRRLNSPNDVVAAQDGSVLFTDPEYGLVKVEEGGGGEKELAFQGVYRVAPGSHEAELLTDAISGPNGLALPPGERVLYVADTDHGQIRRFDVDPGWRLSGDRVFADVPCRGDENPDGMKVDERGNVWCTGLGGVWVFSPQGAPLARIRVPEPTANLAWGDADARTLYLAASSSVYRLRCRVTGYAPHARPPGD